MAQTSDWTIKIEMKKVHANDWLRKSTENTLQNRETELLKERCRYFIAKIVDKVESLLTGTVHHIWCVSTSHAFKSTDERRTQQHTTTNNKIFPSTNYACSYSVISAIWRFPTLNLAQKYSLFLFQFESILGIFFLILYQKLIRCKIMRTLVL